VTHFRQTTFFGQVDKAYFLFTCRFTSDCFQSETTLKIRVFNSKTVIPCSGCMCNTLEVVELPSGFI
jgi:hypothetical protein